MNAQAATPSDDKLDLGLGELSETDDPGATAGELLTRVRQRNLSNTDKGEWFEKLFVKVAPTIPEFQIAEIHHWKLWDDKQELLPDRTNKDLGIDAVARLNSGEWVAIQCKCYDDNTEVKKTDIDKFVTGSQEELFALRWIVSTSPLGKNVLETTSKPEHPIRYIDFWEKMADQPVSIEAAERQVLDPWPEQQEAINKVVKDFKTVDRGKLIMACGTGKTFTSLRIAEKQVADGGTILFAAPSIALVSQARREWLRQTARPLDPIVVCSDSGAGGRGENTDISINELECPVLDQPQEIATRLTRAKHTAVVFCTYQSLDKVIAAQQNHNAPQFSLAIADEAHRTTGVLENKAGERAMFQQFHDNDLLKAAKRLYMTATPRVYTSKSKGKALLKGIALTDMDDEETYGWEMHRLSFRDAVKAKRLADYRVIVLGVSESAISAKIRARMLDIEGADKAKVDVSEMARVRAVALAINGVIAGNSPDKPECLPRTLAFANNINRSKWYAKALEDSQVKRATSATMSAGETALRVEATHLDGKFKAFERNREIRRLQEADNKKCRVISNVKLFTEGVDIPALDAVAFLDPRKSQVDIVQAVGRIMRQSPGKKFGYIIVPVVLDEDGDIEETLANSPSKFKEVGKVLQALRSHDPRMAEDPTEFLLVGSATDTRPPGETPEPSDTIWDAEQLELLTIEDRALFAKIATASGLGNHGSLVADDIAYYVEQAAGRLREIYGLCEELSDVLDLPYPDSDKDDLDKMEAEIKEKRKHISVVAALMLYNACLLHRRLADTIKVVDLLETVNATAPIEMLAASWRQILKRDYSPVFRPALDILLTLDKLPGADTIIRSIAQSANREADSLSELGYDHAGPLYHKILGTAKSDGAFYTKNSSAVLLARLALEGMPVDWADPEAVANLKIMDPACGTGTLLMAAMQTVKHKVDEATPNPLTDEEKDSLHKNLVEKSICGLDINKHGIQLAACNLTLGAPTVDYEQMNLATMPHGVDKKSQAKAGSLEILETTDKNVLFPIKTKSVATSEAEHVIESSEIDFDFEDIDLVIMNPPYTASNKRGTKYSEAERKAMQKREQAITDHLKVTSPQSASVINSNSIATYFTSLSDILANKQHGTIAKVIPTTACTGTSGIPERKFLADRFHIETIITSHDPKTNCFNFSENTSIHESLLICRRKTQTNRNQPTKFVSLKLLPHTIKDAIDTAEEIRQDKPGKWVGSIYKHDIRRVEAGDWMPCQFLDGELYQAAIGVSEISTTVPLQANYTMGPSLETIYHGFKPDTDGKSDIKVFWSRSTKVRQTMSDEPEQPVVAKESKADKIAGYLARGGNVLLTTSLDTQAGRVLAIYSDLPAVGSQWIPLDASSIEAEDSKAICAWLNSTPGSLHFFNNRARKLTNAYFQAQIHKSLPIPDFNQVSPDLLIAAFEQTKNSIIEPWKHAASDPVRAILDEAAAKTIGIPLEQVRDWRERLAKEPTISNQRI